MQDKRIEWLERDGADFPFYAGRPVWIGTTGWLVILLGVAAGFTALITLMPRFPTGLAGFLPALAFVALPLGALALFAGRDWKALFRPMQQADGLLIPAFFLLNALVTIALGLLVTSLFDTDANPAGGALASAGPVETLLFFARTFVQLLGEEIFTILPFLALLTWLVAAGLSRGLAIAGAALVASVIFALVHLPTYQWHWGQCLVGLVPIRIVLLLPYIITKNIWVSTAVHVANDWAIFGLPLLAGAGSSGDL